MILLELNFRNSFQVFTLAVKGVINRLFSRPHLKAENILLKDGVSSITSLVDYFFILVIARLWIQNSSVNPDHIFSGLSRLLRTKLIFQNILFKLKILRMKWISKKHYIMLVQIYLVSLRNYGTNVVYRNMIRNIALVVSHSWKFISCWQVCTHLQI